MTVTADERQSGRLVEFGTKAETLVRLGPALRTASVLPLIHFTVEAWTADREAEIDRVMAQPWAGGSLVVRSSASVEDLADGTQAGRFRTETGVLGRDALGRAVDAVIDSYAALGLTAEGDQVLVQPELTTATASGVASSCDPNSGAPYWVITWTDGSSTSAVTAGTAPVRTWVQAVTSPEQGGRPGPVPAIADLLGEVVRLTGHPHVEIEFAVTGDGAVILFQARRLWSRVPCLPAVDHAGLLDLARACIEVLSRPRPRVLGKRPVFGVMPDWNPAEIIGVRPRPLAYSLYRHLVMDDSWAEARYRYGYRDVRSTPLLVDVLGLPYVDVRASFTSLLPRALSDDLGRRLVNHYLARLAAEPHLHDKIEFEIVLSCNTFDLDERLAELNAAGICPAAPVRRALTELTNAMIDGVRPWQADLVRVERLAADDIRPPRTWPEVIALLDRCAQDGVRPFAGLARAAFVGTQLLNGIVSEGILTEADRETFLASLSTVTAEMSRDVGAVDRSTFLERYGHLRPGTYDILSRRYDEDPDCYFDWTAPRDVPAAAPVFRPGRTRLDAIDRLLRSRGFTCDARTLLDFVAESVKGRERAKFVFSRLLSGALVVIGALGRGVGLSEEDMSYVRVANLAELGRGPAADRAALAAAVAQGKQRHRYASALVLPPLIRRPQDATGFEIPASEPNFVTAQRVTARTAVIDHGAQPSGAIALVTSADPGYDWLFAHGIRGLVTAYGGVNSHMAVRARELGVPAAIGVGEVRLRQFTRAAVIELDCANRLVRTAS